MNLCLQWHIISCNVFDTIAKLKIAVFWQHSLTCHMKPRLAVVVAGHAARQLVALQPYLASSVKAAGV